MRQSLFLAGAAGLILPNELGYSHVFAEDIDRLVLLGTQGGPLIRSYKQTPSSNLLVYKNMPIVIDTGFGVTFKLLEAGINPASLKYIFITHNHSDHNLELGPIIYNAWIAGLKGSLQVYGPTGIKSLLKFYWESNRFDIETRVKDEGRPDIREIVIVNEYSEGNLISNPEFQVSALRNIHPPIEDSFALKFNFGKKSIVFSGDTAYCPPLARFASDAEYLIHEVMYAPAIDEMVKKRPNAPKLKASILSHHTSAEDVGRIAKEANVKTLILNHFVPPDDRTLTDDVWINAVRTTFPGKIIVGKDLLQLLF